MKKEVGIIAFLTFLMIVIVVGFVKIYHDTLQENVELKEQCKWLEEQYSFEHEALTAVENIRINDEYIDRVLYADSTYRKLILTYDD